MGGGALVERDEFVGLVAGELAAAAQELLQALPLRTVCGHEDVEIHPVAAPLSQVPWLLPIPSVVSLADWRP